MIKTILALATVAAAVHGFPLVAQHVAASLLSQVQSLAAPYTGPVTGYLPDAAGMGGRPAATIWVMEAEPTGVTMQRMPDGRLAQVDTSKNPWRRPGLI